MYEQDLECMKQNLYQRALTLTIITIIYNLTEGIISVIFGVSDDTLVLIGFGIDSFVEIISAFGILHMILRMKRKPIESPDKFEKNALIITGIAFYILSAGLAISSFLKIYTNIKPETTLMGIAISSISILTMWFLMRAKLKLGKKLNSNALIADANCTKTCFYLSFILLFSSIIYEITGFGWIDVLGSLGIALFSFTEGREAFEKAKKGIFSCICDGKCH